MIGALGFVLWFTSMAWAGELVPPSIVDCPTPLYPAGVDAGPQRVTALLRIDEQGAVVRVTELTGAPEFVAAVEPVAASCRFTPASEDGEPVTVDQPFAWDWAAPVDNLTGRVISRGDRIAVVDATRTYVKDVLRPRSYCAAARSKSPAPSNGQ